MVKKWLEEHSGCNLMSKQTHLKQTLITSVSIVKLRVVRMKKRLPTSSTRSDSLNSSLRCRLHCKPEKWGYYLPGIMNP